MEIIIKILKIISEKNGELIKHSISRPFLPLWLLIGAYYLMDIDLLLSLCALGAGVLGFGYEPMVRKKIRAIFDKIR